MKALVFDLSGITEQDSTAEPVVRIEEIKRDAVEPVERGGVTVTAGIDAGGDVTMMNYQDWLKWGERFEAANARIAELEARNIELEQRLCIMVERGENREAQLADAHREIERSHEIIVGQNEEIVKAKAERDEANARAEAAEAALTIARERCHFWGMQASEREEWLRKAESRAADLAKALDSIVLTVSQMGQVDDFGGFFISKDAAANFDLLETLEGLRSVARNALALNPDAREKGVTE